MEGWKNQLYFGDNLEVLRKHIPVDSIDLIYLDPPFNSNATYNMLFKEPSGEQSAAQIAAFDDTWKWGPQAEEAFDEAVMAGPPNLAELLKALHQVLRRSNMLAYLSMMAVRLVELHRVLKPTGSLFLALRPHRQPLHQAHPGQHLQPQKLPQRNHLGALPAQGPRHDPLLPGSRHHLLLQQVGEIGI